jgi:glycosyltransferase involved in cell wall biosynthesis
MKKIDILIPVYNEDFNVLVQVTRVMLKQMEENCKMDYGIIIVDDCSKIKVSEEILEISDKIGLVRHETNQGYGAALKTGIRSSDADWFAIIDADGTYPPERISDLLSFVGKYDSVIGVRTGNVNQTPLLRRFPKKVLNGFASYLAKTDIVDLNSGMRVFSRELAEYLWELFPQRFSFSSTLTMGAIIGGFRVKEVPIDYFKRSGSSSIHPIKDTVRFFKLAFRLGVNFAPMRIFGPLAFFIFLIGFSKGAFRDIPLHGALGNFSLTLMLSGLQIFMMGVLGDMMILNRKLSGRSSR